MEHEIVDMVHASKFDKTYKYFKTKNEYEIHAIMWNKFVSLLLQYVSNFK